MSVSTWLLSLPTIGGIYGTIKIIYDMIKGKKIKEIVKSHEFYILIISIVLTFIILFPWENLHYINPKSNSKKDTANQFIKVDTLKKQPFSEPITKPHKRFLSQSSKIVPKPHSDTNYKAKIIVTAPNYGNQQNGDGNTMNVTVVVNGRIMLSEQSLRNIFNKVIDLVDRGGYSIDNVAIDAMQDTNQPQLVNQIAEYFEKNGRMIHMTGFLNGRMEPVKGIKIDIANQFIYVLVGTF